MIWRTERPAGNWDSCCDVTETGAFTQRDFAAVGGHDPREDSQQRRFAGAVGPDQADAVTLADDERDSLEEGSSSKAFRQTLGVENGWQLRLGFLCVALFVVIEDSRKARGCRR